MNENLYYYLLDNNFLTHGIGEVDEDETYFKFESIIKNGGLMSLDALKEMGINVSGKVSGYRITAENQISFFDPTVLEIKKRLLSENYYYFLPFHPNVIFFIIDRENLNIYRNPNVSFEMNADDVVSIDSFRGIIAPSFCCEHLDEIQKKYGLSLPIYDFDFNITNSFNKKFK